MSAVPREVGPIEGREVYRSAPDHVVPVEVPAPSVVAPSVPPPFDPRIVAPAQSPAPRASKVRRAVDEIRHSRGRNVPNSRPLPEWVRKFAWFLDNSIPVPGTAGRRVGVDGVIAVVPVAGDVAGVVMSLAIVLAGVGAGVSIPTVVRMLLNVGLEALAGLVPIGGVLFDLAYKANMRNVALIERDLADRRGTRRSSIGILSLSAGVVVIGFLMLIAISMSAVLVIAWSILRFF